MSRMQEDKEGEVVLTGATGLVGRRLVPELERTFAGVRVLSRSPRSSVGKNAGGPMSFVWDGIDPGLEPLSGARAVVHLAGEPIFGGLPTADRLARVRKSRIESTRAIVERMSSLDEASRPRTFVCASAVGYYGDRGDERLDESADAGTGFLAEVCRDWEAEALRAAGAGVRVVSLRIGVVLSKQGGALGLMRIPFSLGLGGRLGSGQQFFPWIHLDDLVSVILWALESPIEGAINAVAPEETRNLDLTRALGEVLHRPTMLPVPRFALRLALGELSGELLGSRRVRPQRLEDAGFAFEHPTLASALDAELG